MKDSVTVTGHGSASGAPDVLEVQFALQGRGLDVAIALDAASAATEATLATIRARGVGDADIRTGQIQVHQRFGDRGQRLGFESRQVLAVTIRDLTGSGAVLRDAAAAAPDALAIDNVALVISDPEPLRKRARDAAFADARRKAEQFAGLSGRQLGRVREIVEGSDAPIVRQMRRAAVTLESAVPVEAGEQAVAASVVVTWQLAD